jgi:hypothetical protein
MSLGITEVYVHLLLLQLPVLTKRSIKCLDNFLYHNHNTLNSVGTMGLLVQRSRQQQQMQKATAVSLLVISILCKP